MADMTQVRRSSGAVVSGMMLAAMTALCPSEAAAEDDPRPVGSTEPSVIAENVRYIESDEVRYIAYWRCFGCGVSLYDTRLGTTRPSPSDCSPRDGRVGRFLLVCVDESRRNTFFVLDPRTARIQPISGARAGDDYTEVGRHWLRGEPANFRRCGCTVYLDYRRGVRRVVEDAPDTTRDLDARNLRPIPGRASSVLDHEPPRMIFGRDSAFELVLKEKARNRILARKCFPFDCFSASLSRHFASWVQVRRDCSATVRGYRVSDRSRSRWHIADPAYAYDYGRTCRERFGP